MAAKRKRTPPPAEPPEGGMWTPQQLAAKWGCSVDFLYDAINTGKLRAYWIGGWKIELADAEAFKAGQAHVVAPAVRRRPGPKPKFQHVRKGV